MAGLEPAIHKKRSGRGMPGWVYMMTNRPNGTLYVGVTDDLARRAWEHREGLVEGFTKQYRLTRLVFAEYHDDMRAARQRERNMKHWRRS
jgi:putative endonuclease